VAVGVKVTLMVQEPLPAILVPQVLVCVKGPLIEMLPIVTALEIELLTVIFWTALVVPTSRAAKISVGGLNEMAEEVPMRLTTCGLPGPLVVMKMEP
jgi:hypothetical protein